MRAKAEYSARRGPEEQVGGAKELALLRLESDGTPELERTVLDAGIGPTQVVLVNQQGRDLIVSANHAAGEVAMYEVEKDGFCYAT